MGQAHRGAEVQPAVSYEHTEGLGRPTAPCQASGPTLCPGQPHALCPAVPCGSGDTGRGPARAQGGSSICGRAGGHL